MGLIQRIYELGLVNGWQLRSIACIARLRDNYTVIGKD
jgi:hypothetical protein